MIRRDTNQRAVHAAILCIKLPAIGIYFHLFAAASAEDVNAYIVFAGLYNICAKCVVTNRYTIS